MPAGGTQGEAGFFQRFGRGAERILGLLPFCTAFIINLINPQFMSVLRTDPVGRDLLAFAALMVLVGLWWMRKIIRIHV